MANPLRYTLVGDGSSDRVLVPIIDWVLREIPSLSERSVESQWADLREQSRKPGLAGKIERALQLYPCDLLFVHRDVESSDPKMRRHRLEETALDRVQAARSGLTEISGQ